MSEIPNLDECRSVDDYATVITDIKAQIAEINDGAAGRRLNAEERAPFAALQKLLKDAEETKAELEERATYVEGLAGKPGNVEKPVLRTLRPERTHIPEDVHDITAYRNLSSSPEEERQAIRDGAMKVVERARFPHPKADEDGARDHVAKLLDTSDSKDGELARLLLTTGSPRYKRIFNKYLSGKHLTNEEERYAAITTGGTTTGGYATPWEFDPTIIAIGAHTSVNPYRAACRVVPIVGTNKWEALTATAVLAAYAGEAVAPAEGGPTFAQPTYECLKAEAFVTASIEILADRPDVASEMAVLIQDSKDTLEESSFAIGAGTTVPWGMTLLSDYTTLKTVGAAAVIIDDVIGLEADVPIRHRMNGAWFMSRGGIRKVQALETTGGILFNKPFATVGNPLVNATGNTGLQLLGYPIWESPSIVDTFTTPDTNVIWFGDPKSYVIVDRVGLTVELVQHVTEHAAGSRPTGQRGIYAYWRNTARRINVDAGRTLVVE